MRVRSSDRRAAVWHLRAARLALTIGDAASAVMEMQRLLGTTAKTGIQSSASLRLIIDALIELQRFDEALRYVEVGRLAYPNATGFCVRGARLALLRGDFGGAVDLATTIVLRNSTPRRDVLAILAEGYARIQRPADALRIYRQLVQDIDYREVSAALLIRYAETCLASHEAEEGLRLLSRVVRAPALLRARLLTEVGRTRDALDAYDQLLIGFGLPGSIPFATTAGGDALAAGNDDLEDLDEESLLAASLERIAILDRLGELEALRHLGQWELDAPSEDPRVRLALARVVASAGQSDLAFKLISGDRGDAIHGDDYLGILLTIAEVEGRTKLADLVAKRLSRHPRGRIVEAARRALMARILRGEALVPPADKIVATDAVTSSTEFAEMESPLLRLARNACGALTAMKDAEGAMDDAMVHLTNCRVVLHRCRQKAASASG